MERNILIVKIVIVTYTIYIRTLDVLVYNIIVPSKYIALDLYYVIHIIFKCYIMDW